MSTDVAFQELARALGDRRRDLFIGLREQVARVVDLGQNRATPAASYLWRFIRPRAWSTSRSAPTAWWLSRG